jgi:ribosomal protein S21
MIIVPVKNEKSLEQALKTYKFKIYKTKQIQKLQERLKIVKGLSLKNCFVTIQIL